jgi:hypothetical protein
MIEMMFYGYAEMDGFVRVCEYVMYVISCDQMNYATSLGLLSRCEFVAHYNNERLKVTASTLFNHLISKRSNIRCTR